ncbi:MAG: mechanosensitive ion channel family protein [Rubricoccaceae bacterium]
MQLAPLDSLQAVADSLRAAADSLARRDTLVRVDTLFLSDTTGVGALSRNVEDAARVLAEGRFAEAAEIFSTALLTFAVVNLLPAIFIAAAFWALYRVLRSVLRRALATSRRMDAGVQQLILRGLRLLLYSFAAVTVLDQLGINVTTLIAGLGIAGIALGFAARDTLENFIAGITILLDRPFRVGDYVEVQDTFGTVEEITLRTTRVRTIDNQMAILPNALVITSKIVNHSMLGTLRVVVPFGIAYKESPEAARRVVLALTEGDARLHPDFAPTCVVTGLGDSSVDMALRLYLKDPRLALPIRFEYQERVFDALTEAGIEIPFPHLQLFIDEAKAFGDVAGALERLRALPAPEIAGGKASEETDGPAPPSGRRTP